MGKAKAADRDLRAHELAKALGRDRATVLRWIANESMPTCGSRAVRGRVEWRAEPPAVVKWLEERARLAERERLEAEHGPELERLWKALKAASGDSGGSATWQGARAGRGSRR